MQSTNTTKLLRQVTSESKCTLVKVKTLDPEQEESDDQEEEVALRRTNTGAPLREALSALLPDALRPSYTVNSTEPIKTWGTTPGKPFLPDVDAPTLSESLLSAGRDDMVAGVDDTSTITEQLQLLLRPVKSANAADSHSTRIARRASGSLGSKPSSSETALSVGGTGGESRSCTPAENSRRSPVYIPTDSTVSTGTSSPETSTLDSSPQNEAGESSATSSPPSPTNGAALTKANTCNPLPKAPDPPSAEPPLFLQAADSTGSA